MECRWNPCLISVLVLLISTLSASEVFDAKDYDAVGDGKSVGMKDVGKVSVFS